MSRSPADDERFMARALALAESARLICPPNPAVGCVIVDAQGSVLGEGHTQPVGQAHAEVMALRAAQAHGHSVHGATAYVTLEPCAHHGRTGPCCEALVAAGIGRVVASLEDPNPRAAGCGAGPWPRPPWYPQAQSPQTRTPQSESPQKSPWRRAGTCRRRSTNWPGWPCDLRVS